MRSLSRSSALWKRAVEVIPGGTMTESKKPSKYVDGVYPKFIQTAKGGIVQDPDGNAYVDFISSLGAITLGYEPHASIGVYSLPSPREIELAELLRDTIPAVEMSKFFKTGSEACSAAVKAARAITGREKVVVCGYHGWHDWYTVVNDKKKGIPGHMGSLVKKFRYNDLADLEEKMDFDTACVIMEPVIYDEPLPGFLESVRSLCTRNGSLFILDEMVTGFRFKNLTAQNHFGITPDLSTFGKGMANGVPMAAVCGKKKYMDVFADNDFFCSGTYNSDLSGIEASIRTIGALKVFRYKIESVGKNIKDVFNRHASGLGLNATCKGYPCRTYFDFPTPEHKSLFWQECIKRGILFGYANFPTVAHYEYFKRPGTLDEFSGSIGDALRIVARHWGDPVAALEGKAAKEVFRLIR